jgi:chlorite dismutase
MGRQFVRFAFYAVDPAFRLLEPEARERAKKDLAETLESRASSMLVRTYSTVGFRGDCDLLVWSASEDPDDLTALAAAANRSELGPYLRVAHSYFSMTKPSKYVGSHEHAGQEGRRTVLTPGDAAFLFVYPFWKTHQWYQLPFEERMRLMKEHFEIGHKYPNVRLNTTYAFGLDDPEFVLAFEADDPSEFLALVEELRGAEQRPFTLRDTPIFTCRRMTAAEALDQIA